MSGEFVNTDLEEVAVYGARAISATHEGTLKFALDWMGFYLKEIRDENG